MSQNPEFMTSAEVADAYGVTTRTVARLAGSGQLKPVAKLGGIRGAYLFDRADVERIAQERAS